MPPVLPEVTGSTPGVQNAPSALPRPTASPLRFSRPYYELGDRSKKGSDDIKKLQKFLNEQTCAGCKLAPQKWDNKSKFPGGSGRETNVFGIRTEKALMNFQRANGLQADGILGPKTQAVIYRLTGGK